MRKKIYNGLTICFLILTFFSAFIGEVNAQSPRSRQNKKPSEQAKKLAVQGDLFYRQKDYRSAIGKYAEAIVAAPNYSHARFGKAARIIF